MESERVIKIKQAWMARTGKSEEEWINFKPDRIPSLNEPSIIHGNEIGFDSFSEVASSMEFIFCPDEREMGFRYRTKARYFRNLAEKSSASDPVQARNYREEAKFWDKLSENCFRQARENRSKL